MCTPLWLERQRATVRGVKGYPEKALGIVAEFLQAEGHIVRFRIVPKRSNVRVRNSP